VVTGLGVLVTKVSIPNILFKFWAAAYPETLSHPNDNGMVPQQLQLVRLELNSLMQDSPYCGYQVSKLSAGSVSCLV
jgi:hypothetical protein